MKINCIDGSVCLDRFQVGQAKVLEAMIGAEANLPLQSWEVKIWCDKSAIFCGTEADIMTGLKVRS